MSSAPAGRGYMCPDILGRIGTPPPASAPHATIFFAGIIRRAQAHAHYDAPSRTALLRLGREVRVPYLPPVELGPGRRASCVQRLQHRRRRSVMAETLHQMPETLSMTAYSLQARTFPHDS